MPRATAAEILQLLDKAYPDAHCELNYGSDFQLLVAVILSAQCTDKRVNIVTEKLFKRASTPADFAAMSAGELEPLIYSCGFYRNKAKNIIAAARDIIVRFDGRVPDNFDQLLSLAGVGRKTANVIMSVAFHEPAIAVDTHVFRVSHRLGLSEGNTPYEVEKDLSALIEPDSRGQAHHLLIFHGRYCCRAQHPDCERCVVRPMCIYYGAGQ